MNNHRYKKNLYQNGSQIIEFAFALPILIVFILSILEVGFFIADDMRVDSAAQYAAREIKTGNANKTSLANIKNKACDMVKTITACSNVKVIIQSVKRTQSFLFRFQKRIINCDSSASSWKVPNNKDLTVVVLCVKRKVFMPGTGLRIRQKNKNYVWLRGVEIFMVEPK